MGQFDPLGENDKKYVLAILDDFTHYLVVYILRHKEEAATNIRRYVLHINNLSTKKITTVRCDNAIEFISEDLREFFGESGIDLDLTPPYAHELNGLIERMLETLSGQIRALLYSKFCPLEWWPYAAEAAAYLINRSPTDALDDVTPFERWMGHKPDLRYVRKFGAVASVYIPPEQRRKLDKRAWFGIIVGYTNMGYRVYNPHTRKVHESANVIVDETNDIRSLVKQFGAKSDESLVIESEIKYNYDNIDNIIIKKAHYVEPTCYSDALQFPDREHCSPVA